MKGVFGGLVAALPVAMLACVGDSVPTSLRPTPAGTGPQIVFDLTRRPIAEVPLPNDIATFPDPTSRTGLRLNVSLVASTHMEQVARGGLDEMEGWGTFEPITVAFAREAGADPTRPALDLANVTARMQHDDYDFSDDPVYLINLTTGLPVPLDAGEGSFPAIVSDLGSYFPNDFKGTEQNLLFESVEEGAGLTQADYRPALDKDFDGVLDHPNTFGPAKQWPAVDNLLTWYERETDTLILRPIIPLDEKTLYGVVITDRLTGPDGQPVRSPLPDVYQVAQRASVGRIQGVLADKSRSTYFGDMAGTGLDHVAFAWSFTTQPVHEDLQILRDGLYGHGPFARFATQFPATASNPPNPKAPGGFTLFRAIGKTANDADEPASWQQDPRCAQQGPGVFTVKFDAAQDVLKALVEQTFGYSGPQATLLESEIGNIDHTVIGTFQSPYLLGDPASNDPDLHFHLDYRTGNGDVNVDKVHFYITIPKADPARGIKQPYPVVFWGHGVTGADDELLLYAGHFAKQGLATIGIDYPEHGRVVDATTQKLATGLLAQGCLAPWTNAIFNGRAHDLNGDGVADSGGLWWTSHVFHTRDIVRQGILDDMNTLRILRTFDGKNLAQDDYNGDGQPNDKAGDFDGDGTPDLGGPGVGYFSAGESLGGIMSEIHGGIDPFVAATGSVSGGGGLASDLSLRSYGINDAVVLQILGPLIIAVPATDRPPDQSGMKQTQCKDNQSSVRFYVTDLTGSSEVEIACLDPNELGAGMTIVVTNIASKEVRCTRTLDDKGRFRVPIPTSIGDPIDIQVYNAADAVDSYKTCNAVPRAPVGRRIHGWEVRAVSASPVGDPTKTCPSDATAGCQQFHEAFYRVCDPKNQPCDPLVAPQEGLGLARQTPALRRIAGLLQGALDPADPINYAPYYMLRPLIGIDGQPAPPHGLLNVSTVGDGFVNISTGINFARAAGALPFLSPAAAQSFPEYADYVMPQAVYTQVGGATAMRTLIDRYQVEGISRLARAPADSSCDVNYTMSATCTSPPGKNPSDCQNALFDADWISEGQQHFGQEHLMLPLRMARDATVRPTDPTSIATAWGPRIAGTPFGMDGTAGKNPLVAAMLMYFKPTGQHSYDTGDPCESFDTATYMSGALGRFFATGGTDLYYLSHPSSHRCLADLSCDFLK